MTARNKRPKPSAANLRWNGRMISFRSFAVACPLSFFENDIHHFANRKAESMNVNEGDFDQYHLTICISQES
jgi:hypothetical protein